MASTWKSPARPARMLAALAGAVAFWALAASAAWAQSATIDSVDSPAPAFKPSETTVAKGATVRWEFDEAVAPHTVTSSSANWSLDVTREPDGAAVEHTFTEPGVYTYLCKFHAEMRGTITVEDRPRYDVLVFSKTTGFRHTEAINAGHAQIAAMGQARNFRVVPSEDSSVFTDAGLREFEVVVLLNTDGENTFTQAQRTAFERWMQRGGGLVGIHAAANTDRNWAWMTDMMGGAQFRDHPSGSLQFQQASVDVVDPDHPSTAELPDNNATRAGKQWVREDEWYNFTAEPQGVHPLLKLDESSYVEQDGSDGVDDDHPIAWCSRYDGGRHFYTGLGHHGTYWQEPAYQAHVRGAIEWAAGEADGDCGAEREGLPTDAAFDKVTLDSGTENPMEIAVADDGSVYYVELAGRVKRYDPSDGSVDVIGTIPVHRGNENGLLGITLDPDFETNRWLYLFYSDPVVEEQHVSRFTVAGDNTLDMASEKVLLRIPHQRVICCHSSGSLTFGPDGNLYISTGDDTQHAESQGYNPIDDRLANEPGTNPDADHARDARRSSGNTNDLRGKILRIRPQADGTYTIPAGNLFGIGGKYPGVEGRTRPEIYTMGHRNPFRISVDSETGWLYNGEVGPDAGGENANRGPRGYDELNQIREAGNMGWPYCIADNKAYSNWDFSTLTHSGFFDCDGGPGNGPLNDSAWNTGLEYTPPTTGALLWWPYQPHANAPNYPWATPPLAIPQGPGRTAIAGPTYHFDSSNPSESKFPAWFDDKVFFADWSRDWIATLELDEQGRPKAIQEFMPNTDFRHPHDIEMGADGSLYVLEWGRDFNYAGSGINPDSGLYRIDYAKGTRTPVAKASADKDSGPAPLTVAFSSEGSDDADGDTLTFSWDFDDGTTSSAANPTHTFTEPGTYRVRLTATDSTGKTGTSTVVVNAGNTRPTVELTVPVQGGIFNWGDEIPFEVTVTDPEETTIDCSKVTVNPGVFHDEGGNAHVHPGVSMNGCTGTYDAPADSGHEKSSNIALVLTAAYTDNGGAPGSSPLEGASTRRLTPKTIQAEHYTSHVGTQSNTVGNAEGGRTVGYADQGEFIAFEPVSLHGISELTIRYAAGFEGGMVDVREGSQTGPVVGTATLMPTASWTDFQNVTIPLTASGASGPLFFTFRGRPGQRTTDLFDLDEFTFVGKGVASNSAPTVSAQADQTSGRAPLRVNFTGTASDPDGDEVSYAWDFTSDGTTDATTPSATHAYGAPGSYTATLRVSDGVMTSTATVPVTVHPFAGCPASDEFGGSALNTQRWNVVREDPAFMNVSNGALNITAQRGQDIFAGDQGLENIVRWADALPASGPWTATTRVTWGPTANFQNAGLLLYTDDGHWIKTGMVWNGTRTFETIKEVNNAPTFLGSAAAGASFPGTFHLRFVSDGTSVQGQRSADGQTWVNTGNATNLDGLASPRLALYATGSTAAPPAGEVPKVAAFDSFRFNPLVAGSDTTAPVTTHTLSPDARNGWHASDVELRLATEDCATTQYKVGDGAYQAYTGPVTLGDEGTTTVTYRSTDTEGNVEPEKTVTVKVDETAPTSAASPDGGNSAGTVRVTLTGADAAGGSGVDKLEYRLDNGAWTTYTGPITVAGAGQHTLEHRATDAAGNVGAIGTATYTITDVPAPTCPTRDEFGGSSLDAQRWDVVREDPAFMNVANGALNITAQRGQDIHAGDTGLENIARFAPALPASGPWTATARLTWNPTANYQNAGLVIYANDANWIKTGMVWANGRAFEAFKELNNAPSGLGSAAAGASFPNTFYVRFTSNGTSIQAQRSADGQTWTNTGNATNLSGLTNPRVALYATGSTAGAPAGETPHVASFDWFSFNPLVAGSDTTAPATTATLAPAAPNGDNGWYTTDVELRLATEDCATTQYKVGDGAFQDYRGPVELSEDGTHVVTYRSTDGEGNVEADKTVTVKVDATAPTSTATPAGGTFAEPVDVTLEGADGGSGLDRLRYRLDGGDWTPYAGPITIEGAGAHTLEHQAIDKAGNAGEVQTARYTIEGGSSGDGPIVQAFADPESGAAPLKVRFSATGLDPDGGELAYEWQLGDGTVLDSEFEYTFREPGEYTATVTATDDEGDTATDAVTVTVTRGGSAPTVTASADEPSGPAPHTVEFTAEGSDDGPAGELEYSWDFGDDSGSSLAQNPTHRYMEPGTYTAVVTVTDVGGNTGTAEVEIEVTDPPGNRAPQVRAAAAPRSGTAPLSVLFTAQGTDPDGDALTYTWAFGDGGTGEGRKVSHTYASGGTYTATVTATDEAGLSGTATVQVVVGNPPGNQAPTVRAAADPRRGTSPLTVSFTSFGRDPDGDALMYVWEFGDGGRAGGRAATHTYTTPGTYTAKVTVTDAKGATGSATVQVVVEAAGARGQVRSAFSELRLPSSVRRFANRGMKVTVACGTGRAGRARLAVSRRTARRLGLGKRTVASRSLRCRTGRHRTVRLKPRRATARRLVKASRLRMTLRVGVKGSRTIQRRVTIR